MWWVSLPCTRAEYQKRCFFGSLFEAADDYAYPDTYKSSVALFFVSFYLIAGLVLLNVVVAVSLGFGG